MADIVCFGEMLIDFTPDSEGRYTPNPGGAPANVAVSLSRLGISSSFMGQLGADQFGEMLRDTLLREGVDISGLEMTHSAPTSLAFVHLNDGERSFSFYRNHCADTCFSSDLVRESVIQEAAVFHFGSVSMTHAISRSATMHALSIAEKSDTLISYDPNLRPALWPSPESARETILSVMDRVDVVKISDEELFFLSQEVEIEAGVKWFKAAYPKQALLLTLGEDGVRYFKDDIELTQAAQTVERAVDTTGAGDSFVGGFLSLVLSKENLQNTEVIRKALERGTKVASYCIQRFGAIPAMPFPEDIN